MLKEVPSKQAYQQEFELFLQSPKMQSLTSELEKTERIIGEINEDKILISGDYVEFIQELREERKQKQRARDSLLERIQRESSTFRGFIYRALQKINYPLSQKVYPEKRVIWELGLIEEELALAAKDEGIDYGKLLEEEKQYSGQKIDLLDAVKKEEEAWVLKDESRLLFYALEHPERVTHLIMTYAKSRVPNNPDEKIKDLFAQFAQLIQIPGLTSQLKPDVMGYIQLAQQHITPQIRVIEVPKIRESKVEKTESSTPPEEAKEAVVKKYRVGILVKEYHSRGIKFHPQEMGEEALQQLITKRAKNNPLLMQDYTNMLKALQENPKKYDSSGVDKLVLPPIQIEWISHDLWRLHPGRRLGLELSHPQSSSHRVVYAIYERNGQSMIILDGEGFYTHEEYDKTYRNLRFKK